MMYMQMLYIVIHNKYKMIYIDQRMFLIGKFSSVVANKTHTNFS